MKETYRKSALLACVVSLLIVAYGCAALNKGPDGTVQNEEDEEMLRIERFKENVRRDGDTLYLKLDSGDYLGLSDLTDCSRWETCTLYRFVDYLEDVGIYLVSVDYYEGFEYLMVSAKSGEKYMVPAFPKFSPDRKRFVAVSADDSGYNENGVFVWRLEDDGIVSELSYRPFDPPVSEYALYLFVGWKNNHTILLNKYTRSEKKFCPKTLDMTYPATLKLEKGKWKFYEDLSSDTVKCGPNVID